MIATQPGCAQRNDLHTVPYSSRMARHPMRPVDLYLLAEVNECDLHPDGVRVVYSVTSLDEPSNSVRSQLWLHDGAGARQLTMGHSAATPRCSPDGRWLAYLSSPPGAPSQLRVLPFGGGEPLELTSFDDGCAEPTWLPDSSGLVVTAPTRPPDQVGRSRDELSKKPEPRRIDSVLYRFNARGWVHDRRRHIFTVRLPSAPAQATPPTQLTDGPWDDVAPCPSPDGKQIAFVSARHDDREWIGGSDVFTVATRGGRARRLTRGGSWQHAVWHPDGGHVVALGTTERGMVRLHSPHVIAMPGGTVRRLGDGEIAAGGALYGPQRLWASDTAVMALGVRRGAVHIDRYDFVTGDRTTLVDGSRAVRSFGANATRLVFVATTSNLPAELRDVALEGGSVGGERVLTNHTKRFTSAVTINPTEEFTTTSADGYPVHGFVCRPIGSARRRRPGLLYVHGGPLAHYGWGFFDEFQLAAAAGYVVVGINPRGSDGYGLAHAQAIVGALGGVDWLDVEAAAGYLADRDDVDADRLGIGGGSYGGFMTAWATAHSDRFKAALVERAVINWTTMEATTDIPWFGAMMTGGDSVSGLDRLREQSPISHVDAVKTPTLVMHSEEDWRCPIEQGEQWFAALRRRGIPTEFVRFPGENHEFTRAGRPNLRIRRFEIVHEWFDHYLA